MALYIVREGHGEEDALPALVYKLRDHLDLNLPFHHPKRHGLRDLLLTKPKVQSACERLRPRADCEALLLTRDADHTELPHADCPKFSAPVIASWVQELDLPFPTAVVLFYKEYETLFLAGALAMAGQEVLDNRSRVAGQIPSDAASHPDPERPRDAKGWVRANLVTAYKPTLYQTSLTKLLDPDAMKSSGLSSYRRLTNALRFLADNTAVKGAVYPPPAAGDG